MIEDVEGKQGPEERAGSPDVSTPPSSGRSEGCHGTIVVFASLDELRLIGPISVRVWLKYNRPLGRTRGRLKGQVVAFVPMGRRIQAVDK